MGPRSRYSQEPPEPPMSTDASIQLMASEVQRMRGDLAEMKAAFKEISATLSKIALVEERQTHMAASVERAFKVIEKIENRLEKLEQAAPVTKQVNKWVEMGIIGTLAFAASWVASHLGVK